MVFSCTSVASSVRLSQSDATRIDICVTSSNIALPRGKNRGATLFKVANCGELVTYSSIDRYYCIGHTAKPHTTFSSPTHKTLLKSNMLAVISLVAKLLWLFLFQLL